MTSIDAGTGSYVSVDGLEVSLGDGVLSLTLNRPDSLNSLTATMLNGVADALDKAAADPQVKVVRLAGAGRGFSSGAGISADDQSKKAGGLTVLDAANRAVRSIVACPRPVVSVVQGPAAGVGASLAMETVRAWMTTDWLTDEKYRRRVGKVVDIDNRHTTPGE